MTFSLWRSGETEDVKAMWMVDVLEMWSSTVDCLFSFDVEVVVGG